MCTSKMWKELPARLEERGHTLQPTKSQILIPAWDVWARAGSEVTLGELGESVEAMVTQAKKAKGGMTLLGSACQGKFEAGIGSQATVAAPAAKRVK